MGFPIATERIERRHYINGAFSESSDGATFELKSPFSHEKIIDVCEASVEDTNRAVAAAKATFPAWAALDPSSRGSYLKKLAGFIRRDANELITLDAMSMGRPVSTNYDPIVAAMIFEHWAENGSETRGMTSLTRPGFLNMTFRQPIGPVAAIIPWNLPILLSAAKIAPALAAGCTVVLKSSEKAPLSSMKLAALIHEAGFPPGAVNILSGHGTPSGAALSSHMDIRMISFTGSTATGRKIQVAAASSNLKKVVLELGGKGPALIFSDANILEAASATADAMTNIMGQTCMANSRIYVQDTVSEKFIEAFTATFRAARKGDPLLPETQFGPQADELQFERVKSYLAAATEGKSKLKLGGQVTKFNDTGYFVEPTIYTDTPEGEKIMKEEIFGPVICINTFTTEAEAIEKANATEYGLFAQVWTNDLNRAMRVSKAFESGMVGVNCTSSSFSLDMPFGGYKTSGQGRDGLNWSMEEYLEVKTVMLRIQDAPE